MIKTIKPSKVSLFDNSKTRYTTKQVKALTGADYVFNGGIFNMKTLVPYCDMKIDGVVKSNDPYSYFGYGWKNGELPKVVHSNDIGLVDNYISCLWVIHNGEKLDITYPADMGGSRGRTAFGYKLNGEMVIVCTDDKAPITIEQARDKLFANGCVNGIVLDGGGSSQIDTPDEDITSARIVSNFVCVWAGDKIDPVIITKEDVNVTKLIAIDAGHGLNTAGKRCLKSIDPHETREWFLNNRIACYVEKGLAAYDCKTMRLDDITGKTDVQLAARVKKANDAKADVLASIHANAAINGGTGGGICVFAAVNGSKESDKLQQDVYKYTVEKTALKGNRYDGVPDTNFYMIYKSNMPAFLGEFGFMDSSVDTPIILTDEFAKKCAEGIVQGIVEVEALELLQTPTSETVSSGSIFRVQAGAFPNREAAERLVAELSAKGYKTIIQEVKI